MTTTSPPRLQWLPVVGLLGLLAWQGWLTLSLFGGEAAWDLLLDEQPILSGNHPLHQYHGHLGAQALLARGRCSCYDPGFQAGYPRTPIFDSGSRFAELFALAAAGEFQPAAYKIGLAILFCLIPLLVIIAARGVGLNWWETFLAVLLAQLVCWGVPARELLENGEIDLLFAAVLLLAQLGLLIRFDRQPGFFCWLAMLILAALGWFAHPLLFALLVPLLLGYYLNAGIRHRTILWHVGLWLGQGAAIAINALWLYDWCYYSWILSPLAADANTLPHRTIRTLWQAPLWGAAADRALAVLLMVAGLVGVMRTHGQRGQRPTGRLLGLVPAALLALALAGISWEPIGRLGTSALMVPALWFMTVPAARGCGWLVHWLATLPVQPLLRLGLLGAGSLVLALFSSEHLLALAERAVATEPLQIGLGRDQQQLVDLLKTHTTDQARILWEDQPASGRWTALLPTLTGRSFIGGLDPDGRIIHSHAGLSRSALAGEALARWSDAALHDYCRRYNIGWVVVWSTPAAERIRAWDSGAEEVCELKDRRNGYLFKVRREQPGVALHGQAELVAADSCRIILANVVPKDGKVVLSFHYQSGLRATPSRVQIEREPDVLDPVPLMRLKVDSPVSRVVITWDER
jgi:hypothetical protein